MVLFRPKEQFYRFHRFCADGCISIPSSVRWSEQQRIEFNSSLENYSLPSHLC